MATITTEVVTCESWDHFKNLVNFDYAEENSGVSPIFRGQSQSDWKLASPWDRKLQRWANTPNAPTKNRNSAEYLLKKILADFKELSVGLPGIKNRELDEIDWWAIGRHYGLITPLLDWTRSPYVAAFFAFSDLAEQLSPGITTRGDFDLPRFLAADPSSPIAIWAFMLGRGIDKHEELKVLNPPIDIGHRQRAQRGIFTTLLHEEFFDVESYLASLDPYIPPLKKYLIPGKEMAKALTELRLMNITFATLFPDLEGAAKQANFEMVSFSLQVLFHVNRSRDEWPTVRLTLEEAERC
jgi:hypothetical protein